MIMRIRESSNITRFALLCASIALSYLWASLGYISQMYVLSDYISPERIDQIALGYNYFAQVLGALAVILVAHKNNNKLFQIQNFVMIFMISILSIFVIFNSHQLTVIVIFGLMMNLMHGVLIGTFLIWLTSVIMRYRGFIFGLAYAIGSILTLITSRILDDFGLAYSHSAFVYVGLIILNAVTTYLYLRYFHPQETATEVPSSSRLKSIDLLPLIILLLLMAMLNAIGGDYKSSMIFSSKVSLYQTRIYYALGLLLAGFLIDYSRKLGAILCLAGLIYPFVSLFLRDAGISTQVLWSISYLFLGFYTVFRVVTTVDLVAYHAKWWLLAPLGFIIARLGDIIYVSLPSIILTDSVFTSIFIAVLMFLVFLFFISSFLNFYDTRRYGFIEEKEKNALFTESHHLTIREQEVLTLVLDGYSNSEIAGKLFISENTVKFHIKNLLKKTNCSNRTELVKLYREK